MGNGKNRNIAIQDYYGPGEHIYEDELGFTPEMKEDARSWVAREVFRYEVEYVGQSISLPCPLGCCVI